MKKLLIYILSLFITVSLIACTPNNPPVEPSNDSTSDTTPAETTPPPETEPPFDYNGYKYLTRQASGKVINVSVGIKGESKAISIPLPEAFLATEQNGKLIITRDSKQVGEITVGTPIYGENVKAITHAGRTKDSLTYSYDLIADPSEATPEQQFKHIITFSYNEGEKPCSLTLEFNYTALTAYALNKCTAEAYLMEKQSDSKTGYLLDNGKDTPRRILILGNSFISSSQIGSYLNTMFASTDYRITAVSYGYACTHKDVWDDYIARVSRGEYDVLLLCGFYDESDIYAADKFENACEAGNTTLVLFPAHNETTEQSAINFNPDLPVLHWQDEIDMLMEKLNIDLWDFCVDDQHKHSTPLAGYVGAHMIYRALTGKIPPEGQNYIPMSRGEIQVKLGSYMTTGSVELFSDSETWYLG